MVSTLALQSDDDFGIFTIFKAVKPVISAVSGIKK
jgi:hypothetical protein